MSTNNPTQAERDAVWSALAYSSLRVRLSDASRGAQAVVAAIVERVDQDVTMEALAAAVGQKPHVMAGHLSAIAELTREVLDRDEALFPWELSEPDGVLVYRCPEHVARWLR